MSCVRYEHEVKLTDALHGIIWLFVAGCSSSQGTNAGASDAGGDSTKAAASLPACPIALPDGSCREVVEADVIPLVEDHGVCMPAFAFQDGEDLVAFSAAFDESQVLRTRVVHLADASAPENMPWDKTSNATGVVTSKGAWLYFTGSVGTGTGMYRARVDSPNPSPEWVTLPGVDKVPFWPQAAALPDDSVLMAWVVPQTAAYVSHGTGESFTPSDAPTAPPPVPGVLAHPGTTHAGTWVLAHQTGSTTTPFHSFVNLHQGGAWTQAIPVAPEATTVHNAFPIARLDEGADVYYLAPGATGDLTVYRRYLSEAGTFGPAQRVTADALGHVEKPQPRRLSDGRIALMFARRVTTSRYDVALAILAGDAPR